jgi:hypothetical protein
MSQQQPQQQSQQQQQQPQQQPLDLRAAQAALGKVVLGFALKGLLWLTAAVIVVAVLWGVLMSPLANGLKEQPESQAGTSAPEKKPDDGRGTDSAERTRRQEEDRRREDQERKWHEEQKRKQREQARLTARAEQKRAIRLGEAALKQVEALDDAVAAYEKEVAGLQNDDRGKAIAADPDLVRQFRTVSGKKRPAGQKGGDLHATVEDHLEPIRRAIADPADTSPPGETALRRFDEVKAEAERLRGQYREGKLALEAVVARARPGSGKGGKTLAEAVRAAEHEEALAWVKADQDAKKENDKRLKQGQDKLDQEGIQRQLEAARRRAEAKAREALEIEIGTSSWVRGLATAPGFDLNGPKLSSFRFHVGLAHALGSDGGTVRDRRQEQLRQKYGSEYGKDLTLYQAYLLQRKHFLRLKD